MPTIEAERIRTARLSLCPAVKDDAACIAATGNDPAVLRNLSFLTYPLGAGDIERLIGDRPETHLWLSVRRLEDGEIVGVAGLHAESDGGAEIGFWLGSAHWGRGYATEIARALAGLARGRGYDPVWAVVVADNRASVRVLEKAGFIRDGEAVRHYRQRAEDLTVERYRLSGGAR